MIERIRKFNGFFCKDTSQNVEIFNKSVELYFKSLKNSDIVSICTQSYIDSYINKKQNTIGKPIVSYSWIEAFTPFFKSFKIWGENKKILVISPFSETINYQTKKNRINNILKFDFPNCKFVTYQSPITYNVDEYDSEYFKNVTNNYNDWIQLVEKMCNDIKNIDFDIAFISAGIYTMYIGDYIKNIGKKSIYIGGMLNVLFNIYGARYDTPFFNQFINKEYQVDVMDNFHDLVSNNALYVKNEILGAYMRPK